jgi:hypothetical protein
VDLKRNFSGYLQVREPFRSRMLMLTPSSATLRRCGLTFS